jgi:hypothetical protein
MALIRQGSQSDTDMDISPRTTAIPEITYNTPTEAGEITILAL